MSKKKKWRPNLPPNDSQNQTQGSVATLNPNTVNGNGENKRLREIIAQSYEGPMPPPNWLAQYEQIYPGASKIIFSTFEKQVDHRIEIENTVIASDTKNSRRGLILGFILQAGVIGAGIIIILKGSDFAGVGLVVGGFATAIANLFKQASSREKNIQDKKKKE